MASFCLGQCTRHTQNIEPEILAPTDCIGFDICWQGCRHKFKVFPVCQGARAPGRRCQVGRTLHTHQTYYCQIVCIQTTAAAAATRETRGNNKEIGEKQTLWRVSSRGKYFGKIFFRRFLSLQHFVRLIFAGLVVDENKKGRWRPLYYPIVLTGLLPLETTSRLASWREWGQCTVAWQPWCQSTTVGLSLLLCHLAGGREEQRNGVAN